MSTSQESEDKLPEIVAELEMLKVTTRRRRRGKEYSEIGKRRCRLKPIKRSYTEMSKDDEDARALYLDKSVKESPHTLETIYEEDEKVTVESTAEPKMSVKRFKRMIDFQRKQNDKGKQKKRRLKIKKAFGSKLMKPRRMDLKDVLKRLELIRSNSLMDTENDE